MKILRILTWIALISFCSAHVNVLQFYKHEKLAQTLISKDSSQFKSNGGLKDTAELVAKLARDVSDESTLDNVESDSNEQKNDDEEGSLQWVLYVILGGLIFFLVIVALILEKILSRAKSYEIRQKSILE